MKMKGNVQDFAKCQNMLGNIFSLEKWVMSIYMPLIAKMVKNNPFLMAPKVNFGLLCDMNFILFIYFLFVVYIVNNPCTDRICVEVKRLYLWLCYSHQDLVEYINNTMHAFEMEGDFIIFQHLKCWIFLLWFHGFHILGYMFKCPWWEYPCVPNDFH
jgi:hypothetical protein